MANPPTFASAREYVGLAVEQTQGTPLAPVATIPVDAFNPFDQPTMIDDTALRGSMTGPFNRVLGVNHTEFDMSGPAYFDTIGYLLSNIFGDTTYSATYTGSGTTVSSAPAVAGASTITTSATIAAATLIQIDTGVLAEIATVLSVAGSFTLTLTAPLAKSHASGVIVRPVTTPNMQQYSVLNSGNGQPSSLTISDFQGPTPSTGVRVYPGCCLSELTLSGTVESSAITYTAKGMGWPSVAGAAFTSAPSAVRPQAAWETQIGLTGTVQGAPVLTINTFTLSLQRALQMYYTAANTQNPYSIFRGKLTSAGTLNFVAANESPLTHLLTNDQPQLQLIISNGLTGAALLSMQIDIQNCAWSTSKIARGNPAVEYAVTFDAIATTNNAGFSGGFSPTSVTMQNAIAANSF